MPFSLLWLPDVLRAAGLQVIEVPGWQNRGHGDEGEVLGVLCHHTCGPLHGEMPDLNVIIDGRPDLGGPLAQLALGRTGIFHVVAAGKCWHAGAGNWLGVTDGNAHLIGIEAENAGTNDSHGQPTDPWPAPQLDAYKRGVAAILKHIGAHPTMCAGHKEYALPHGRKDDPNFDMAAFRADVAALMAGAVAAPLPSTAASPNFSRCEFCGEASGVRCLTESAARCCPNAPPAIVPMAVALTPAAKVASPAPHAPTLDEQFDAAAAAAAAEDAAAAKAT